jgi:hypothetical protein
MPSLTVVDLEPAMVDLLGMLKDEERVRKLFNDRFHQLKDAFNAVAIGFCLNKFISAELDYQTAGSRGIGRVTEDVPRFGAYFRKRLSRLSDDAYSELFRLIQEIVLRGYLSQALFAEEFVVTGKYKVPSDLFRAWLPIIYVNDLPEKEWDLLSRVSCNAIQRLKDFLASNKMTGGWFLSKDKTDEIISKYLAAGWFLRIIECHGLRE